MSSRHRFAAAGLIVLLGVVTALRLVKLGADPMPELDGGFIFDAGTWWKNARLRTLLGVWTIDDGNYAYYTAPVHTIAQWAVFAAAGLGYAQGYLLNALSGIVSVFLVFVIVRREHSARTALLAAAFTGINPMTLAYDRSAYPESFQVMLMLASVAAILGSKNRPWLAALAGVGIGAVLLAKPTGLVLGPVAIAVGAAGWYAEGSPEGRRSARRALSISIVALAAVTAIAAVAFLIPHSNEIWLHFRQQLADQKVLGSRVLDRVQLFGTPIAYRLNGFFKMEWGLLVVVAAFGAARIARAATRKVTAVELAAWIWVILVVGAMGLQSYQEDRRFLSVIPPLAMLAAVALAEPFGMADSQWGTPRARRWGIAAAAGVLVLGLGFYLVPYGVFKVIGLGRMMGQTWNYGVAGGILLSGMVLAAFAVAAWRPMSPRWRGHLGLQLGLALVALVVTGVKSGREVIRRRYDLMAASETLARLTDGWPDSDRYLAGWTAGTVSLTTKLLPVNHELLGPTAAERFHPRLEVGSAPPNREVTPRPVWKNPGQPDRVRCFKMPVWNDAAGRPRLAVNLFIDPELAARCRGLPGNQDLP